ncbi:MAG: hypothetical protein HUK23_04325 [Sphaerochaetaceae bacterium]|nr:hypothetical protein [Sphaerochaetaceae bacterium]
MDTMEFLYDQDRITRITNTTIFNQGVAKGSEKTAKSMALKMLKEGLSYDVVSRCSGLTLEQIAVLDK